jgi:hypothetical protein
MENLTKHRQSIKCTKETQTRTIAQAKKVGSNKYGSNKARFKHRKINDEIKMPNESVRTKLDLSRLACMQTSLEKNHTYKTMSNTARFLDLSHTNMYPIKTDEFKMDIYSSENQTALSSYYAPKRTHLMKRPHKKRQTRRYARAHNHKEGRKKVR